MFAIQVQISSRTIGCTKVGERGRLDSGQITAPTWCIRYVELSRFAEQAGFFLSSLNVEQASIHYSTVWPPDKVNK